MENVLDKRSELWMSIIKSFLKPTLTDAVAICKQRNIKDPNELFCVFETLLHEWSDAHNYSDIWE